LLKGHARVEDIACRYGGEEFIIILPGAALETTRDRAETICKAVRDVSAGLSATAGSITVSVGVAAYPEHGDNGPDIIRIADATLYQAKRAGRDRVVMAAAAPVN
jgi:diguanylate cyclase (GGDEF)-like protein